jgi:hypothetical protein
MRHAFHCLSLAGAIMSAGIAHADDARPEFKPGRTTNVISDSGNGRGNTLVLSNDGVGESTTVIRGFRNGVGNRLMVLENGKRIVDLPGKPEAAGAAFPRRPGLGHADAAELGQRLLIVRDGKTVVDLKGEELDQAKHKSVGELLKAAPADAKPARQPADAADSLRDLETDPLMQDVLPDHVKKILKALAEKPQ